MSSSCRIRLRFFLVIICLAAVNVRAQTPERDASVISIPEQANATLTFAATELSNYFKKMTGRNYNVVHPPEDEGGSLVCLQVDKRLNHDGYRIYRDGLSIRISGGSPRGCLYGAYTLLVDLGCRFPAPGEQYEIVPRLKKIAWPGPTIQSAPAIAARSIMLVTSSAIEETLTLVDWMAKNGFNFLTLHGGPISPAMLPELKKALAARDMGLEWGGHLLPKCLPRELFAEYPEYFRMKDGKRTEKLNMCPSSPGAADVIAKNAMKYLDQFREFARFEMLHLFPDDLSAGGWCSCEKCKGLTDSDQAVTIINEVAKRLPLGNTAMAHAAYHATIVPPENVMPDDNVRLIWAARERCYKHGLDECEVNRKYLECLQGQIQLFPNEPAIGEYYHDMILFRLLPMPLHPVIGKDIKVYRKAGIARIAVLTFVKFSKWAYGPNYYVLGQSLWRGEGDPQDIAEYCEAVYGPHAEAMREYFNLLFEFCGTVMQLCGYEMGADMRQPPHDQPYAKTHIALLAPLVTSEHLDRIEAVLQDAIAQAAEPYRSRIEHQLLLWRFARLEVPAIYRTMLAGYLRNHLGGDATDIDRQYVIALIKKVFQDMDKGSEMLLAAPEQLRGPLFRDKGIMRGRFHGCKRPMLRRWMNELEKQ